MRVTSSNLEVNCQVDAGYPQPHLSLSRLVPPSDGKIDAESALVANNLIPDGNKLVINRDIIDSGPSSDNLQANRLATVKRFDLATLPDFSVFACSFLLPGTNVSGQRLAKFSKYIHHNSSFLSEPLTTLITAIILLILLPNF